MGQAFSYLEQLEARKKIVDVLLKKLNVERKKSVCVTDEEVKLLGQLRTGLFTRENIDIVWPTLERNPSEKQLEILMEGEGPVYSGENSFWVGVLHSLKDNPENLALGEKIVRAASHSCQLTASDKDYSLINFYDRIRSKGYSKDAFGDMSDAVNRNPKLIITMLNALSEKVALRQKEDALITQDIDQTLCFARSVIGVSRFPEGKTACGGLIDTLHNEEMKHIEEQFEALKETPYTKEDLNSLCDRKELVQTLYKEDKEFIDSCGKTDVQKPEKVYS